MSKRDSDSAVAKLAPPLPDFELESELARELGCNDQTLARPRKAGKFDFILWGGRVWDHRPSVDAYLRSKVIRRNPPPIRGAVVSLAKIGEKKAAASVGSKPRPPFKTSSTVK